MESMLDVALGYHMQGRLDDAEQLYLRVLGFFPEDHRAYHLLGALKYRKQDFEAAEQRFIEAIQRNARIAEYYIALGLARKRLSKYGPALEAYHQAIRLEPSNARALNNIGTVHEALGDSDRALKMYEAAAKIDGTFAEAQYNIGNSLRRKGDYWAAATAYSGALLIRPQFTKASINLAEVLLSKGRVDDAGAVLEEAHAHGNSDPALAAKMALVYVAQKKFDEAAKLLSSQFAGLSREQYGQGPVDSYKVAHDIAQLRYLGLWSKDPIQHEDDVSCQIRDISYYDLCAVTSGRAVNPNMIVQGEYGSLTDDFNRFAVIDDFLCPGALKGIREFCMRSTIWSSSSAPSELISTIFSGLASPLLFQIVEDTRNAFPSKLGGKPLIMAWAYKYVGDRPSFGPHADPGAIAVNFWVTPDEANLDLTGGGMLIWNARVSTSYIHESNRLQEKIVRNTLRGTEDPPTRIPYRSNRAVIFNALNVHATDEFRFAPGYANHRVNITMLFGTE